MRMSLLFARWTSWSTPSPPRPGTTPSKTKRRPGSGQADREQLLPQEEGPTRLPVVLIVYGSPDCCSLSYYVATPARSGIAKTVSREEERAKAPGGAIGVGAIRRYAGGGGGVHVTCLVW